MKKLYLIGSLRNPEIVKITNALHDRFSSELEIFSDWAAAGPMADDAWRDYEKARGRTFKEALQGYAARHVFEFDRHHLDTSDGAVLILPAGRSGGIELGYMVGRGRSTFVLLDSPDRYDVMLQFADHLADSIDELMEQINETLILGRRRRTEYEQDESARQLVEGVYKATRNHRKIHEHPDSTVFELAEIPSS